jgi:hypothetical protein
MIRQGGYDCVAARDASPNQRLDSLGQFNLGENCKLGQVICGPVANVALGTAMQIKLRDGTNV